MWPYITINILGSQLALWAYPIPFSLPPASLVCRGNASNSLHDVMWSGPMLGPEQPQLHREAHPGLSAECRDNRPNAMKSLADVITRFRRRGTLIGHVAIRMSVVNLTAVSLPFGKRCSYSRRKPGSMPTR